MPKPSAHVHHEDICLHIATLTSAALHFVPPERGEAMMRKWVDRADRENLTQQRMMAIMADAILLSGDLLVSQPSASGATAFDRLAKTRRDAKGGEAAALSALCKARFRLLHLTQNAQAPLLHAHDVSSGEALQVISADFPRLDRAVTVFCRTVDIGDGLCCLAGSITPLDAAGLAVATGHQAAGKANPASAARWAEAIYGHVVQHGTLEIPGVNRPREGFDYGDEDDDDEGVDPRLKELTAAWSSLNGGPPDAALLMRTRQLAELPIILDALYSAHVTRDEEGGNISADAVERLLLVQLEVVLRRERSGSGNLTLEAIAGVLDKAVAEQRMPGGARTVFLGLKKRLLGGGGAEADDPALERLVQRIQGLRAKTVAQGCTEQEALAAAEKVAELLDRYGLSLGELDFRAQPCEGIGVQTSRKRFAPIASCVTAIAKFFDCRVWVENAKGAALRYVFFGLRADVVAAQYLYEMVERAFETETNAFRKGPLYAEMAGDRRNASNSFQVGLARGICDKLKALGAARDIGRQKSSGRDLVPMKAAMVEGEIAKLGLDLHKRHVPHSYRVHQDAFTQGKAAGERFEVMSGITQAA